MSQIFNSFVGKGWYVHTCRSCDRFFVSKKEEDFDCGWRKCSSYTASQKNLSKKVKRLIPVGEVLERFTSHFSGTNLSHSNPIKMQDGFNTDFVSAGVQIFSGEFKGELEYTHKEQFLAQPCIRTLAKNSLTAASLSFVNLCTESTCVTFERHLELIQQWISFFSSIGLHASRLKLVYRNKKENWGFGDFESEQIFFVYMGEELGEASYMQNLPSSGGSSLSDIGFGLERITWAVNWFRCNYCELISNPCLAGSSSMHDFARTIALLVCSDVHFGVKNSEGNFRKIVKACSSQGRRDEILIAVMFYLNFWKNFYQLSVDYDYVLATVGKELDRSKINSLRAKYGVDVNPEMTLVEVADYLMYNRGITYEEIQCHIR